MELLTREMQISPREVFRLPTPLDLRGLNLIADVDRTELKYPSFVPLNHPDLARVESSKAANIMTAFRDKDRTHLRDMIDVNLIDATWYDRLPPALTARLRSLIETPGG